MRRVCLAAIAFALLVCIPARAIDNPVAKDRIWFCPSPGSIDYRTLFEHPEEWPRARQLVNVFKFYQQHTQMPAPDIVGPNSYDALARTGAFRLLKEWGIKTAIEVGAVKDFYCTPDASGMRGAIAGTVASIRAIQNAGGAVTYLAMDDPFAGGKVPVCGGPAPEPSADRIATYFAGVHAVFPDVRIGWIEAYPLSPEPLIETELALLQARGVTPAFLHMDVDSRALRKAGADFARDMPALRDVCHARQIPFGILVWGYNGDSDVQYSIDAAHVVQEITSAFNGWNDIPDHIVIQSFAQSTTGVLITPSNLPEDQPYTHTFLIRDIYRRLRGQTGTSADVAVSKK